MGTTIGVLPSRRSPQGLPTPTAAPCMYHHAAVRKANSSWLTICVWDMLESVSVVVQGVGGRPHQACLVVRATAARVCGSHGAA